jgi:hypothetical protein
MKDLKPREIKMIRRTHARSIVSLAVSRVLLLSTPVLGSSLAMADDVPCTYLTNSNGTQACTAHLTGPTAANQTTWDSDGNGHSGGAGGPTDLNNFVLNSATPLSDYQSVTGLSLSPLDIRTIGGGGGNGYHVNPARAVKIGGNGGAGGQPGDITVTVGGAVSGLSSGANGTNALTLYSQGGAGGGSGKGSNFDGTDGTAGTGGTAGAISGTVDGNWQVTSAAGGPRSVLVWSQGGTGGFGGNYETGLLAQGADAAAGGNGGNISITFLNASGGTNEFSGPGGVLIQSVGGAGGLGGNGENFGGTQGGNGGQGGAAGNVDVTLGSNVSIREINDNDAGLHVLSQGGAGGAGGTGASGGIAGAGYNAGNASVIFQGGSIVATGTYSPGVLAQSLGGNGGDGGSASKFVVGPNGGAGSTGGTAGTVSVTGSGINILTGQYVDPVDFEGSPGILAQSIGGGGGSGSASKGLFAVGGDGGNAVAGNSATVDLQSTIQTYGFHSDGIAVQSIGGGGGKGGDAAGSSVGLQMVLGGTGGGGGDGGTAVLTSEAGSVIHTAGDHASGLVVQSIGGGGGDGGAAYSEVTSRVFGSSMSIGGTGGDGGDAESATATNIGGVITLGADSFGMLGQSLGGGGGNGGASTAKAKVYSDGDYPSIALTMSIGGSGGSGGTGNGVQLSNKGLVATSGAGSVGLLAQSVGGGGGTGGDASSASTASGGAYDITASLAFGGTGGSGGDGGVAGATNSGLIVTSGESADGMMVQSVGGGGGEGGSGDAKSSSKSGTSISGSLSIGGAGGGGGNGHSSTAINSGGAIITLGDGAIGIGAQSIGGGGGRAGGAAGSTSGDYTAKLTVGGSGASGGSTNDILTMVTVDNAKHSSVVTFGADATGIYAQSIAGGGGIGGKSATNLGTNKSDKGDGSNTSSNTQAAITAATSNYSNNGNAAVNDYNTFSGALTFVNSLLGNTVSRALAVSDDPASDFDSLAQSRGDTEDENESTSIALNAAVGGSGGSGGDAGVVKVTNDGEVATVGHHSDGIIAQAIGGGGGKAGVASTASSNDYSGNITVGGTGAVGGNGGQVAVTNTGTVITEGALAAGIVGQSIAGGGGIGGVSAVSVSTNSLKSGATGANDGGFQKLNLSVGGSVSHAVGSSGEAGQVYITSSGEIRTAAHDSIGIIAQSIGGGGGIVKSLATDLEGSGGPSSAKQTDYSINLKFGGSGDAYGSSGLVNVTTQTGGTITTKGDDSYGILAQSISGGGGLVLGGKPVGSNVANFFGSGQMNGDVNNDGVNSPTSGNSGVFVTAGANITTSGNGAVGILAQSIGGGGGLAGDTGHTEQFLGFGSGTNHTGDGGYVNVTVNQGATVSTSGNNAPAMFLQSIGGGGGRVTNDNGAYIGTAGGSGKGGEIDVTINGTVEATGEASLGIFAQSEGDKTSTSPIKITVGSTGTVSGGPLFNGNGDITPAIYIDHGGMTAATPNIVTNSGTLTWVGGVNNDPSGTAVYSSSGYTEVVNNVGATITGAINLANNGGGGCLTNNGTIHTNSVLGTCATVNNGVMDIRSGSEIENSLKRELTPMSARFTQATSEQTARIVGGYIGNAGSTLVVGADFAAGKGDVLTIDGAATIAGTLDVEPTSLRKTTLTVVSATGPLTLDPTIQSSATHLFSYDVDKVGNALEVTPEAHFVAQAASFAHPEQAVASSLQSTFDSGATLTDGFAALAKVRGDTDYSSSLRSIAGEGLGAFGAFRINSSRSFTFDLYGGCRRATSDEPTGDNCTWARVFERSTDQDARADTVGYHADATTVEVGGQFALNDKLSLVFALGSEDSTMRDDNRDSRITGSTAIGGAALNYANGPVELSGAVDGAYGDYRSTRTITVGDEQDTATAKPRQWQIGTHFRAAYSVPVASVVYIKPFVDGHAIFVSNDAFTESGSSPFRLAVDGRSNTALLGGVGTEIGANFVYPSGLEFHPFVSAAVEFDNDLQWTTTAHFADQPAGAPFAVRTAGPGTLGRFVAGADIVNSAHWSFSLMYDPDVGHGYTSQAGSARVSYRF